MPGAEAQPAKHCVEYAALSDVGFRRSNNQDSMVSILASSDEQWRHRGHLFIVADGMGGHAAGELASKLAVDTIPLSYQKQRDKPMAEAIRAAVQEANHAIYNRGQVNPDFQGMGTTSSCLLVTPAGVLLAHVGDSRIYRLHGGNFEQLTADHSYVWELTNGGRNPLPAGASAAVPKNVITRSLGPNPNVEVDLEGPFAVEQGDCFLLCSDGLCGQLSDEEMAAVVAALPPSEAVEALVHLANLRGGPDNITVIIVKALCALGADENGIFDSVASAERSGIHPGLWGALGGTVVAALLMSLVRPLFGLIAAALGLVVTLILHFVLRSGPAGTRAALKRGNGPYRAVSGSQGEEVTQAIADIHAQLRSAAIDQDRVVDWNRLEGFERNARQAAAQKDHTTAVREYCRAVTFLMRELKNQPAR